MSITTLLLSSGLFFGCRDTAAKEDLTHQIEQPLQQVSTTTQLTDTANSELQPKGGIMDRIDDKVVNKWWTDPPVGKLFPFKTLSFIQEEIGKDLFIYYYFDDYGHKQCIITKRGKEEGHDKGNATIITKDEVITWDLEKKSGYRKKAIGLPSYDDDMRGLTPKMYKELGVVDLQDSVIMGKTCKGFSLPPDALYKRIYSWEGIAMMLEIQNQQQKSITVRRVIELKVDEPLPTGIFDVPADVSIYRSDYYEKMNTDMNKAKENGAETGNKPQVK